MWGFQKLGIILENQVPPSLKLAQDGNNKCWSSTCPSCLPKKGIKSNKDNTWYEKLTLKTQTSRVLKVCTPADMSIHKIQQWSWSLFILLINSS